MEQAIYETPDSPDIEHEKGQQGQEQQSFPSQYESEFVSQESFDPQAARGLFNQREVDNAPTGLTYGQKPGWRGYVQKESEQEKFARLQREIEELRGGTIDHKELDQHSSKLTSLKHDLTRSNSFIPHQIHLQDGPKSAKRISLLEARLSTLEQRLGSTSGHNLAAQIALLRVKVQTLQESPASSEVLLPHLQQLNKEIALVIDSPVVARIQELHKAINTVTNMAPQVPLIVERLKSLQNIHETAAESKFMVDAIRAALASRATEIAEWKSVLQTVESQMKQGETAMQKNLVDLTMLKDTFEKSLNLINIAS